ncbi:unnamed protein product [Musa acuminata subsp. burmannicoides]
MGDTSAENSPRLPLHYYRNILLTTAALFPTSTTSGDTLGLCMCGMEANRIAAETGYEGELLLQGDM